MRHMNERGLRLLKSFESCRLQAYRDGGGVATIGWGHTAAVHMGQSITQFEADELLKLDLEEREAELTELLGKCPTSDNEFSALLSLVFNIGFGSVARNIPGLKTSTVLKRHRLGNPLGASRAFVMWNKDNGKIVAGLTRRREAEAKLYLGLPE